MPNINIKYIKQKKIGANRRLTKDQFAKFNTSSLGLGDISLPGRKIDVVCAILDLEGFTQFCNQPEQHLVVPEMLGKFIDWVIAEIKNQFTIKHKKKHAHLFVNEICIYGTLPLFIKFMGDGLLLLWDTKLMAGEIGVGNIIVSMRNLVNNYRTKFHADHSGSFSGLPIRLRCGLSRGQVISIGSGNDYVGSCINLASRLQKLHNLSFAVSRRGVDPAKCFHRNVVKSVMCKHISIRGIGDEVIIIWESDFNSLSEEDKNKFQ